MRITCLFILLVLLSVSCQSDQDSGDTSPDPIEAAPSVPSFNKDSAYQYVARQVEFGPRVPGSEAHAQCRDWLIQRLREFDAKVSHQDFTSEIFTGQTMPGTNIIGQYNPNNPRRILLAAHWDSRFQADSPLAEEGKGQPVPGADDGASGVGVLLEVARQLSRSPVGIGVDIVFFDLEDQGNNSSDEPATDTWGLGAQHFAANLPYGKNEKPEYGILLDMVGSKGARFGREKISANFAPRVLDKVWKLAQNMGYGAYFVDQNVGAITDDHLFINRDAKIPMIDIINRPVDTETGFGAYWHTQEDNMEVIDRNTLRAVGQLTLAVVYRENAGTLN